ncbi:MAG: hypothetical protein HFF30_07315, partial [Flavonifractor sp.]|nr:hypothetical protein [Flavonifractor sp.]
IYKMAGKKSTTEKKVYTIGGEEVADLKQIKYSMIEAHVKSLGKKDIKWLIEFSETKVEDVEKETNKVKIGEDGKPIMRDPTYLEIRNAFATKYFPDLASKRITNTSNMIHCGVKSTT